MTTLTDWLADRIAALRPADLPAPVRTLAGQCLLDWIGVTLGAAKEPATAMLAETLLADAPGNDGSAVIGRRQRLPMRDAVLLNGMMGHLLDYDDVHPLMGHPAVPVMPCALAVGERLGASGAQLMAAIVAGYETECRVGAFMGGSGYAKGWHSTATHGAFGAMATAGWLYRLDRTQWLHAFGIAGTQAAGLKSVFGTMTKPLHAGLAAQAGLLAVRLAQQGFTSQTDILTCPQGYGATQSDDPSPARGYADPPGGFYILGTLFKYHAACYLTHSAIEAAARLREDVNAAPDSVARIFVDVDPGHLGVCNIAEPATGLEMKFSLRMTVAAALAGENTADEALFSDATANRPDLLRWRDRVTVRPTGAGSASTVTLVSHDGATHSETVDTAVPEHDLDRQQARLEAKMRALAEPVVGTDATDRLIACCRDLHSLPDIGELVDLLRGQPAETPVREPA